MNFKGKRKDQFISHHIVVLRVKFKVHVAVSSIFSMEVHKSNTGTQSCKHQTISTSGKDFIFTVFMSAQYISSF